MTTQSAQSTFVYRNATYSPTAGSNLVWDTIVYSCPAVTYTTSNGNFVMNYPGRYLLKAYYRLNGSTSTGTYLQVTATQSNVSGSAKQNNYTTCTGNTTYTSSVYGSFITYDAFLPAGVTLSVQPGSTVTGSALGGLGNGNFATLTYIPSSASTGASSVAATPSIVYLSSGYAVNSGAPIQFNTIGQASPQISYNTSTYTFTALQTGIYELQLLAQMNNYTSGAYSELFVNGVGYSQRNYLGVGCATTTGYVTFQQYETIPLTAGETFYWAISGGGGATFVNGAPRTTATCFMSQGGT
jgi:hypothetical protein